ncbi:MAG: DUF1566 domain-containing protein, partial [Gammaproteobacteria bacterium]|nr:DUF1566 domain-containing protein [Gammaproteobacteria bacterium]
TVLGVQSYQFIPTSTGGPVVKWELDNAPSWLSIVNSVTGEISGSPSYLQVGLYEDLILRAIGDQGIFDQIGPFSIEVLPPIPSLQNVNIVWYTEVDKSVQFQALSPTQANEWSISPGVGPNTDFPWLSLDSATGMLSGTPPNDALGTHQFTLTASNGSGSNTSTLNLGVQAPAAPGFLEKLGDVRVPAYRTSSFSLASQEQANFVIEPAVGPGSNYPWITLDVFDNQAADMYISPDIENIGEHIFTVTASNGGGSDNFTMKVIVPDEIKLPVNLIQSQNGIVIEWQGLADASLDYHLSIAAEPGVTSDNYQTLSEGAHFSSISPPHTIESLVTGKPYFLQIEVSSDSGKRLYSQKLTATPSRFNDTGSTRCVPQSIFYQADPCVTNNAGAQDATLGSDATNSYWIADPMVFDYRWHVVEGFHFKKVEANSDTCVQDQVTGLLWEKKSSTNGNLRDYTNRYTWASAQDYVAAVNSQGLCGRSDWRLPNILELSSISDVADNSFDLEKAHFIFFNNNTEQASHTDYWTADEDAENNTNAWLHSLALETIIDTKVNERSVRLVSGIPMASTLIANGDGTVTDTTTGLMWKLCPEGMSYDNGGDANAANDSCTGSPATLRDNQLFEHAAGVSGADGVVVPTDSEGLGYNDWRVPNIKELQSIVNYSSAVLGFRDPLIGASLGIYWSSTLIQDNSSEGLLGIDFSAANVSKQSWGGVGAHMLRLVRAAVSPRLWLRDADGDGVGVGEDTQYSIHKPDGYVNGIYDYSGVPVYDCNDADASVSPLADDIGGDGIDNNCNGRIDDYFGGVEF